MEEPKKEAGIQESPPRVDTELSRVDTAARKKVLSEKETGGAGDPPLCAAQDLALPPLAAAGEDPAGENDVREFGKDFVGVSAATATSASIAGLSAERSYEGPGQYTGRDPTPSAQTLTATSPSSKRLPPPARDAKRQVSIQAAHSSESSATGQALGFCPEGCPPKHPVWKVSNKAFGTASKLFETVSEGRSPGKLRWAHVIGEHG
jgi:hypothetical protein